MIALSLVFPLFNTIAMPVREVNQPATPGEEQTFELLPTLTPAAQRVEPQLTSSPAAVSSLPGLEAHSLTALYQQLNPGDTVDLTILRNGQEQQLTVTLEPRPENLEP